MIEVESLTKRYGPLTAVDGVSFRAERGDVLGFLGPNGAGKTTTVRIITGYMPATEGRVAVAGHDVFEHPREVKRKIGYLPERPPLYGDMVVYKYLDYVAELKGMDRSSRKKAVDRAISGCGLDDVAGRLAGHLSKGYRQRLGIAQAIVNDPEVLILDEPTIGLDPRQMVEAREMIKSLAGRRTVILSSHILSEVARICNRVIIIHRGKIVADDYLEALRKSAGSTLKIRLRVKAEAPELEDEVKSLPGVKSVNRREDSWLVEAGPGSAVTDELAKMVVQKGWGLEEIAHLELSLEEVFLSLVEKAERGEETAAA